MNWTKLYTSAENIGGDLGSDLLHHVFIQVESKLNGIDNKEGYIYRVMINQWKNRNSDFCKKYRNLYKEYTPKELPLSNINTEILHQIISDIENEGFELEVFVFREHLKKTTKELTESIGIRYVTAKKIINFVTAEIKKRYERDSAHTDFVDFYKSCIDL